MKKELEAWPKKLRSGYYPEAEKLPRAHYASRYSIESAIH